MNCNTLVAGMIRSVGKARSSVAVFPRVRTTAARQCCQQAPALAPSLTTSCWCCWLPHSALLPPGQGSAELPSPVTRPRGCAAMAGARPGLRVAQLNDVGCDLNQPHTRKVKDIATGHA